jgi:hypothetical protein
MPTTGKLRRVAVLLGVTAAALTASVVGVPGAEADPDIPIHQNVAAQTTLKKLNQQLDSVGTFDGVVDLGDSTLVGDLAFEPSEGSLDILGLEAATVGVAIQPIGQAQGTVDLATSTVQLNSSFNIRILYIRPLGVEGINLVGNNCITSAPVELSTTGTLDLATLTVTLAGEFEIPKLKNCGLFVTPVLNLVVPGPGNTFTAVATPQ